MVTADHGSAQPPERARRLGLSAERVKKAAIKTAITAALDARYGKGDWVLVLEDPSVYLNHKLIEERKLDAAALETAAGEAALTLPGFLGYVTRTQLLHGQLPPVATSRAIVRASSRHVPGTSYWCKRLFVLGQVWRERLRLDARQLLSL